MSTLLRATGIRTEPRFDQALEWSSQEKGELLLTSDTCKFNEWVIENHSIDNAVVNTEKLFDRANQSLAIQCGEQKYLFGFYTPITEDFDFPFPVRFTNNRSFAGKALRYLKIIAVGYGVFLLIMFLLSFAHET